MSASEILKVERLDDTKYKGEARTGYSAKGGGLSADVSIDPGKIVGIQVEIGVSAKLTRAGQAMIVAHRGPRNGNGTGSLIVNNFVGALWEGKAGASVECGISASAKWGQGRIQNDKGEKVDWSGGKAETSKLGAGDDGADTQTYSIEAVSFAAEAKAAASVNAEGTYSHYYGKCVAPLFYDDYKDMEGPVRDILTAPKEKAAQRKEEIKKGAIQFMNMHKREFRLKEDVSYTRRLGMGHIPSAELISKLKIGIDNMTQEFTTRFGKGPWPAAHRKALGETRKYIALLGPSAEGTAFMHIAAKQGVVGGKIGASATAKYNGLGLQAVGLGVEVNLADMEFNRTWTHIRFQSHDRDKSLIWTHDTAVVYHNSKINFLTGSISGSARSIGVGSISKKKEGAAIEALGYNWISYKSSIIYWKPTAGGKESAAGEGSGLCNGRSFSLETLYTIYKADAAAKAELQKKATLKRIDGVTPKVKSVQVRAEGILVADTTNPTFRTIREGMNVDEKALKLFFEDEIVRFMIIDLYRKDKLSEKMKKNTIGSAFIEVVYRKPTGFSKVKLKSSGHTELDAASSKELREGFEALSDSKRDDLLCAIRLRVRQVDLQDDSHTLFSLGFKLAGTGFKLGLERVDKAGIGGFVELRSVFFNRGAKGFEVACKTNHGSDYQEKHEKSVPPANLYCQ